MMNNYTKEELLRLGSITDQVRSSGTDYTDLMVDLLNQTTQVDAVCSFFSGYIGDLNVDEARKIVFEEDKIEMPKYLAGSLSRRIIAIWRLELCK
jgi:hypothetical protein